jgi:hypothetical protein
MSLILYRLYNIDLRVKAVVAANSRLQARAMMTEMSKNERGEWIPQTKREKDSWKIDTNVQCVTIGAVDCAAGVILKQEEV